MEQDIRAYRSANHRTRNGDLILQDQKLNAALGLGEAGELQNIVKKEIYHGHGEDRDKILDEAGDILYYLDWLLESYGWTLSEAMYYNERKLAARYPNGFSSADSINRTVGS